MQDPENRRMNMKTTYEVEQSDYQDPGKEEHPDIIHDKVVYTMS